jgi:hypothetical protein
MNNKLWARLAAVGLSLATTPSWSQAPPAGAGPSVGQQLIHLDTALAVGVRCDWLRPMQRLGLEAALRQSRAAITAAQGPAGLTAAEAANRVALEPIKTFDCAAPQATAVRANVETAADEVVATHLFRAEQIATFDAPWAKGVARLKPSTKDITDVLAKLRADNPQRMTQIAAANSPTMAMAVLALNCKERRGAKAVCPQAGNPSPADMAFVHSWLDDTETFAAAYFATQPPP